ncbi:MAG: cytochrome c biogenesis protein DipZ [Alphaproteobacteria bacterium]|nr:cytochrome c biogenesis protein DipZ [Alphaproteobacteria bacterium]
MSLFIEPILAFFEGMALIISPCILPILPLVLSASIDGGRRRPFGIIIGFSIAFSLFTFASRKLVNLLGIQPEIIQYVSLILIALFALILLSNKLSEKFNLYTQNIANIGGKVSGPNNQDGLMSGIIVGSLIGLVWLPCAGPILAVVLVQIIRQQTDFQSFLIILFFAIGSGVPMLIISLIGRKVMKKINFFTKHATKIRKVFGIIILLSIVFIVTNTQAQFLFSSDKKTMEQSSSGLQDALDKPYPAPAFSDIQGWINSNPLEISGLKGKVVLIDFWTYSCINCIRTLPYITKWDQKYRDKGLVIIGVHSPEFEFEKNINNVKAAVLSNNIKYPVALDSNLGTWINFNNSYWPAHYLIDKNGQVVYTHFGEGKYDVTENNIRFLLGMDKATTDNTETSNFNFEQTPETYLGFARAERYVGEQLPVKNTSAKYEFPINISNNSWALEGNWKIEDEKITSTDKNASLRLNFKAKKVFLVLGTANDKPIDVKILFNNKVINDMAGKDVHNGIITVNQHTLYELINQPEFKSGFLEIQSSEPGLEAYAFTFGG